VRGPSTSSSQIETDWAALTAASDIGGATASILTYDLQWDAGNGGTPSVDLVGVSPYTTSTSFTVTSGVTGGGSYQFRVRAKNKYGWGNFSTTVSILAATPPSTPASVTTTQSGTAI
jgi:hypothetical protein